MAEMTLDDIAVFLLERAEAHEAAAESHERLGAWPDAARENRAVAGQLRAAATRLEQLAREQEHTPRRIRRETLIEAAGLAIIVPPHDIAFWRTGYAAGIGGMREAIRALQDRDQAGGWIEAPDVPPELEGRFAWWRHRGSVAPDLVRIPRGYSRDRRHCGGIWYWPVPLPPPTPPAHPRAG